MSSPAPAITTAYVEVPIPVDTIVRKVNADPRDKIRDGHLGRVMRVFAASPQLARERKAHHGMPCSFGYDVRWDKLPGDEYVLGIRLEAAESPVNPDEREISGASLAGRETPQANPDSSGSQTETGV